MKRIASLAMLLSLTPSAPGEPEWVEAMKKVHAKFTGQAGTVAQYGDSITITMAFWAPLNREIRNLPPELAPAHAWLRKYVAGRCWEAWKGDQWGNNGGTTSAWGAANIARWLKRMNPEVALVMWGTNDTYQGPPPGEYGQNMRKIIRACLDSGTIPILYTIPPVGNQAGNEKRTQHVEAYVRAVRKIAADLKLPLIDFYAEILARRPTDFAKTLLGDNLHPSYPKKYERDFSPEGLKNSGYTLRNYLTLRTCYQVHQSVLAKVKSARDTDLDTAWIGRTYKGRPAVRVRHDTRRPTAIDGYLGEPVWKNQRTLFLRLLDGDPSEPKHPGIVKLYTSPHGLFVAFVFADAQPGSIVATQRKDDDDAIFTDDVGEVFLYPGPETKPRQYYHLAVNAAGSTWTALDGDKGKWNPSGLKVGAKRVDEARFGKPGWHAEIWIPWTDLKLPKDKQVLSGPWRLNVTRSRPARSKEEWPEETALSPTEHTSSHRPWMFAYAWLEGFGGEMPRGK